MIQGCQLVQPGKSEDLLVAGVVPKMLYPMIGVGFDARAAEQHRRCVNQNSHAWSAADEIGIMVEYAGDAGRVPKFDVREVVWLAVNKVAGRIPEVSMTGVHYNLIPE